MGVLGYEQIAKSCYEMADAMIRERGQTNHDAVPEARAITTPLNKGAACNTATSGTGNTPSEAEIDALEYVVEEGRIASMDDYGILRSLLVRVRPEWESESYEESDENRMNTNMNRDATPSEGSVNEGCTLTDAERLALEFAVETGRVATHDAATLRNLLARLS
jgi:hypothetical protein